MPSFVQASFAKGELAPALHGRVDTAAYQIGLRTARNAIVHASGGISNRAGLMYVGPCKDHSYAPRLIDFDFKTTDAYELEFGDFYMRVIRDDAHVTEPAKTITAITQASPAVVSSTAHGFNNGDDVLIEAVVGMTRLNGRWFHVANKATDTFQLADQVTGVLIDSSAFAAYVSGGTASRIYTVVTPYAHADLDILKFVQSADVMTLTHPSYPIAELTRTAHDNWTFSEPTFAPSIASPTGETVTPTTTGTTTLRYAVTATSETGEESLTALNDVTKTITSVTKANPAVVGATAHGFANGDEVEINAIVGMTELNGRRFTVANKATDTFELQGEDSTDYTAYASGGTANQTFVEITNSADGTTTAIDTTVDFDLVAGAVKYTVYRQDNGLYGLLGETELATFHDDNIDPDTSNAPPTARNPFLLPDTYAGTASYYEQRRVFGGSNDKPDTSFYSQTGNAKNFSSSIPSQSDDAITATLNARQVNEIRHYIPGNDLIVLTSGSEWRVNSGQDAAFEAATLRQKPQSNWGCSQRRPLTIGNTSMFITENDSSIRTIGYSLQIDAYTGNDLLAFASHLLRDFPATDWAFARVPDPVIYVVREDGELLAVTYNEEQQMVAWTHSDTLGKFEAVSSLRHPSGDIDDAAYFVVKRRINGNTVRYIERTHSRRFTDVRDCFFVDCGLSFDNPVAITNITSASPIVVTAAAHGFSNGDEVDISDVEWVSTFDSLDNETQPDQLNGRRYFVINKATDSFQIALTSGGTAVKASDFDDFADYVDGGNVRKAALTFSGLDHLEGQAVAILADGNVVPSKTVVNGAVTLPRKASRVHVGLKYICDVETLNIEAPSGSIQGFKKRIPSVVVRFERSRGLFIGPTSLRLVEMKQREFEKMGDPTGLLSGDKEIDLNSDWNTDGRVFMRQRYPLPMTILAVIPKAVQIEDKE